MILYSQASIPPCLTVEVWKYSKQMLISLAQVKSLITKSLKVGKEKAVALTTFDFQRIANQVFEETFTSSLYKYVEL